MAVRYEIIEFPGEKYQVCEIDDETEANVKLLCKNAGGGVEATPYFTLAKELYCSLTGEDPDTIDSPHVYLDTTGLELGPDGGLREPGRN